MKYREKKCKEWGKSTCTFFILFRSINVHIYFSLPFSFVFGFFCWFYPANTGNLCLFPQASVFSPFPVSLHVLVLLTISRLGSDQIKDGARTIVPHENPPPSHIVSWLLHHCWAASQRRSQIRGQAQAQTPSAIRNELGTVICGLCSHHQSDWV